MLALGTFSPAALSLADGMAATALSIGVPDGEDTELTVGETLALLAVVTPAEASGAALSWSSGDEACATVDGSGLVAAVSAGTAEITAAVADSADVWHSLTVTVVAATPPEPSELPEPSDPPDIAQEPPVSPPEDAVPALSVAVTDADGFDEDIAVAIGGTLPLLATVTPANAEDTSVVWSLESGAEFASIDEATGLLTGVSEGVAVVMATATAADGSLASDTLAVAVIDPNAASTLGVDAGSVTVSAAGGAEAVAAGYTLQLFAEVLPADADDTSVVWSLESGAEFASIDEATGLLTGIAAGSVTVRASSSADGVYGDLTLTVVPGYEYVLVLNTNPDPTQIQSTGTLVFGGTGGATQPARSAQAYDGYSDRQFGVTVSGYAVGDSKHIGGAEYICIGVGAHCFIWMERGLRTAYLEAGMADTAAAEMMAVYEGRPYRALTTLAGGEIPSMDGTGKLSILLEQLTSSSGYYAGEDGITAIHIKTPAAADYTFGDLTSYAGLLAHEGQHALFQHFVCGDDAGRETPLRWLNEGLSVAVMDWVWGGDGNGERGWLSTISENARIAGGESLAYANYRDDSGLDYGLPYLFVRYLTDQAARRYDPLPHLAKFYQTAFNGNVADYLDAAIGRLGLSGNATFAAALKNFYIAAVVQSGSGVNGFYGDPVVKTRMTYPLFDGASGASYTLPGTGALVLRTRDGVFTAPAENAGGDIVFIPFNADASASGWGGGTGTPDDPYLVGGRSILSAIALNPSGHYRLTGDIAVDEAMISIDTFSGTLDGNGHTITGLGSPLIYKNTGVVRNLNVELALDGSFSGSAGGVVCWNTGTVQNVTVTGSFAGSLFGTNPVGCPTVGALVGQNDGNIYACKADVSMSFSMLPANHVYLGQIAGKSGGVIRDCIAAGSIRAAQGADGAYSLYAGGLAGGLESSFFAASLKWSYSLTQLSVQATGSGNVCRAGRLVGCEEKKGAYDSYVEACYGLEGLAAAGYAETAQTTLDDSACLRTDAQLRRQASYDGWDFDNVWSMPLNGYPSLGGVSGAVTPTASARKDYFVGEAFDLTGATVTAGSVTVPMTEDMLYFLPDLNTAGDYIVLGLYEAVPFSFPVTVTLPPSGDVTALTVAAPARSDYLAGQRFEPDGVALTATIGGEDVTIVSGFTVSKTAALAESDTQITYSYCGQTAAQAVRVAPRAIVSIVRTAAAARTVFSEAETLSLSGLTLRLTYSDGEQIDGVTAGMLGQYGLMLLRLHRGALGAFSVSKSLSGADDDGAELYVCLANAVPASLAGSVHCYATTLTVENAAHMPDQTITLHIGFHEYLYSDAVEGGSEDYSTTLVSGALPAGITAIVPSMAYNCFRFDGEPQAEFDVSLRYLIRDNVQMRQFYVTIRLMAVPPSDACDILEMSLGGVPCTIAGNTVSVVLPQGSSRTGLMINASLSPGAKQDKMNGTTLDCTTEQSLTVYAQSNRNNEPLAGKYKVYTIRASVATASALATPGGVARTGSVVTWNAVADATGYLVTLMRRIAGTDSFLPAAAYTVTETRFDMRPVLPSTGSYYVTVQAVDGTGAHPVSAEASTAGDVYYGNLTPVRQITVTGPAYVAVNQTGGFAAAIAPENAGNTAVTWSVAAGTGTAEITQSGVLTGRTAGTVTVKATAQDGSGVYGALTVSVVPADALHAVTVDVSGMERPSRVLWIDGVPYSGNDLTVSGTQYTVRLASATATNAIVYSYNSLTETDAHKVYPTGMAVWLLRYTNGAYAVTRAAKFDNLLRYAGSSIRITGNKGIRMITSISTATKTALTGGGIDGYTLLEYGTAVAWKNDLGASPLVLGRSYTKAAYAYKKNVADPIYKQAGGLTQYTNVLVGFTNEKCRPDLVMRPYIVLQNAVGQRLTLYGGMIERSIGYIAYQNRNAFAPKSASYRYIWSIIHYVYRDAYDAEYRG